MAVQTASNCCFLFGMSFGDCTMTTTKLHHTAPYCTILHRLVASLIATHALSLVSGTSAGKVEAGGRVEGSLFRDNKGRGGSNLLNCAAPLHWDLVGHVFHLLLWHAFYHGSSDHCRAESVDGDVGLCEFLACCFDQADDAGL